MSSFSATIARIQGKIRFLSVMLLILALAATACSSGGGGGDQGELVGCSRDRECRVTQYCRLPDFTCGALGERGFCQDIPTECPLVVIPACGCDGVSYTNSCAAVANLQSIAGVSACASLVQDPGEICGGPAGIACRGDSFCNVLDGTCGDLGSYGFCTEIRFNCDLNPDPVCGCDGVTYQNTCFSQAAGVSIAYDGPC